MQPGQADLATGNSLANQSLVPRWQSEDVSGCAGDGGAAQLAGTVIGPGAARP